MTIDCDQALKDAYREQIKGLFRCFCYNMAQIGEVSKDGGLMTEAKAIEEFERGIGLAGKAFEHAKRVLQ